ncbi:Ubiquitin carboxyl-terminal hydrolase [Mycena sanguinolenta]|uniref:Ubiquitin carboxyl-terminal hydrolase n=1 Tax=Mycena sanguinolenta TaxID=230812 RepID=A0A8H6XU09_9AGAR|nr:Ubiquitin carboxyl-terminal hydrolase [Mycena sanguinolenta]
MAKGKTPSPQELYKARKQREEQEKLAFLPPGLLNHGNTCFMNSVLQGLIATRLLSELIHFAPIPPSTQAHSATLLASRRSPQLTNGHDLAGEYEKQWVNTMPVGDMFVNVLHRAWETQYRRRRENLSPKPVLATLGKKYDQYLDFAQQDAHEFLRILLDAMSMEELDVIKKSNPPPPKKRRRTSAPSVPPPEDAPITLADMVFGGKLASILVCQKCKHVSQTYEDFSDLSLSLKQEDYHVKKRDRFKSFAKRLGAVVSLGTDEPPPRAHSVPPTERPEGFGEPIPSTTSAEEPRRRSLDIPAEDRGQEIEHPTRVNGISVVVTADDKHIEFADQPKVEKKPKKDDDGWAKLGRRLSLGLASKASKDKERKGRSAERASRDLSYLALSPASSITEQNPEIRLSPAPESRERSPEPKSRPPSVSGIRILPTVPPITIAEPRPIAAPAITGVTRSKSPKPPKPSAGETAYLRQILADVSTTSDAVWLKLGNSLPGVEECLRMFTAVEVLDGENMVGCRRCWKIANGQYVPRVRPPDENYANGVDEDGDSEDSDNHESPVVPVELPKQRPMLPTSLSSPLIYSISNIKAAESTSSLPLITPPSSASDSALERSRFGDDTDTITPPSSSRSGDTTGNEGDRHPPTPSADTFETSGDGGRPVGLLESIVEGVEHSPSSPPSGVSHSRPPDTNALQPPRPHHQRQLSDESSDGSSDESDTSVASGQASSAVSEDARSDAEGTTSSKPRTKPKKPKPVIMRPAYKRYLIAVPPPVLVIHLKRFQQVSKTMISFSNGFKKLDDYVTFPETLDLTPFLAPKKEDYGLRPKKGKGKRSAERCMYRLYAVVVHIGNMLGGHYISYVALPTESEILSIRGASSGAHMPASPPTSPMSNPVAESSSERQWAYISDTVVRLTTLEEVLKAKAYICMYERV